MAGFFMFLINTLLYRYTAEKQIDTILTITSLLGGSLGIVFSILIFDRKAEKGNMMSRVFIICVLIIQIIIFLILKGHLADNITFAFWTFFDSHKVLMIYLVVINFATFAAFAVDKIAAIEHKSRIRIVTLLALAFVGGSLGAILAMYILRHKTRKDYFTVGVPLIMVMQIVLLFYVMNAAW
jgi:uncharacterized membrane protein YsdA (DUF1294 family)